MSPVTPSVWLCRWCVLAGWVAASLALLVSAGGREAPEKRLRDEVVEMPPFVVSEARVGKTWRYAAAEGFEIVSQSDDDATQQVFAALWRGERLTLPSELRPQVGLPLAVVIYNQPPDEVGAGETLSSSRGHFVNLIKRTLHDREVFSLNLHGRTFTYTTTFRFHLRTLLALRTPTAPRWLREALNGPFGVYDDLFNYDQIFAPNEKGAPKRAVQRQRRDGDTSVRDDVVRVGPIGWPGVDESLRVTRLTPPVLPVERLWSAQATPVALPPRRSNGIVEMPPFVVTDLVDRAQWSATAALFAHWALFADGGKREAGFWRFAARAGAEPVTEAFFRECFDLGYAEAHAAMVKHRPAALAPKRSLRTVGRLEAPLLQLRDATPAEIARVRGEFERGEAVVLQEKFPKLANRYRERARFTLRRGLDAAPDDALLAATLGLLEAEAGHADLARPLLENAFAAGTLRPRAALVLAQLRYGAEMAALKDGARHLDAPAAQRVRAPLQAALQQTPKMVGTYELLAQLWRTAPSLDAAEMSRVLHEGQVAFPTDVSYAFAAARACFERGRAKEAGALLERCRTFLTDPAERDRIEETLKRLETTK